MVAEQGAPLPRRTNEIQNLQEEAKAVFAHFKERPVITAEDATEDDDRWIMRYDAVCAAFRKLGI